MNALLPALLLALPMTTSTGPDEAPAPVRIGLFLASDPDVAAAMRAGATEALAALPDCVQLVTRQASAGWDGGARRAAALVFEDRAQVVIAPPDARQAHDAALVTTRSRTPILHLSQDRRLRHSRVPWSFCLAGPGGPAADVRSATRNAVTLAAAAALAARAEPATLLEQLNHRIPRGDVLRRSSPVEHATVPPSPSVRCPEDSPRSPNP